MRTARLGAAVLLLSLGACSPRTPLSRLFADLESAVESRDAAAVVSHLTPEFQGQNAMRPAEITEELRRYFFAYESVDVTFSEIAPQGEPPARVSVRVDMTGKPKQVRPLAGLAPELAAYRFDLDLAAADGRLRISGARWERLDKGPQ